MKTGCPPPRYGLRWTTGSAEPRPKQTGGQPDGMQRGASTLTTTDTTAERPDAPRGGLIARHPLVFFFTLTCLLTWGWDVLSSALTLQVPSILKYASASAPTLAALLILAITSGKPGVLRLLRSYVRWRVGLQWYLVAVVGVAVLIFLSFAAVPGVLADFVAPDWSLVPLWLSSFVAVLFLPPGGPLLEEGGWRGFALPRLQRLPVPWSEPSSLGRSGACGTSPSSLGPLRAQTPMRASPASVLLSSCS